VDTLVNTLNIRLPNRDVLARHNWRIVQRRASCNSPKKSRRMARGGQHGQALVEFLLIAPLLVALLAGIFEYGWYAHARSVAAEASMEAARTAAVEGAITPDAVGAADSMLQGGDLALSHATYTLCVGNNCDQGVVPGTSPLPICALNQPGQQLLPVTVTVTYHYQLLFPFLNSLLFLGIGNVIAGPFTATTTMPAEVGWISGVNGPRLNTNGGSIVCP
jgi:Flp pilus assembly protein TadG